MNDLKITKKQLEKMGACPSGIEWFCEQKTTDTNILIKNIISSNNYSFANWYITKKLKKIALVKYAIYAAEQVINIYTKKYPDDKRPQDAIQAAKNYIKNPNKNAANVAYAAANAASVAYAAEPDNIKTKIIKYGYKLLRSNK